MAVRRPASVWRCGPDVGDRSNERPRRPEVGDPHGWGSSGSDGRTANRGPLGPRLGRQAGGPMGWWDPAIAAAGLLVGVVVGLTGMGAGALMTPILVFFFGVAPLAAVSSDVVASFFMKPVGGLVHLRRGTVHLGLVRWLCLGSVPGGFCGVLLLRLIGDGADVQDVILFALGAVLVLASLGMAARAYLALLARERARTNSGGDTTARLSTIRPRPLATALGGVGLPGAPAVRGLLPGPDRQHPRRCDPRGLARSADLVPVDGQPRPPRGAGGPARVRGQVARRPDRCGPGDRRGGGRGGGGVLGGAAGPPPGGGVLVPAPHP